MDTPLSSGPGPGRGSPGNWPDAGAWAADWLAEASRTARPTDDRIGPAHEYLEGRHDDDPYPLVELLVVLAEAADGDAHLLAAIGAGPLEDLVSHSGRGLEVLPAVDRAARQRPAFRAALRTVWLAGDEPAALIDRLVEFGVAAPKRSARPGRGWTIPG